MRLPLIAAVLASMLACSPAPAVAESAVAGLEVTITRTVDGDTFEATGAGGGKVKVRALGIDTPETKDPRKPVQCFGLEASAWAKEQLQGRRVTLVSDSTQDARDRFGRVLAYVERDGWDYSVEAARAGMARAYVYDKSVQRAGRIRAAERQAQAAKRGLWGPPCNGRVER